MSRDQGTSSADAPRRPLARRAARAERDSPSHACHALLNHAAYLVLAPHQPRHVLACLALLPRHALLGCPAAYQGDDASSALGKLP